jgi:hypothetical protein
MRKRKHTSIGLLGSFTSLTTRFAKFALAQPMTFTIKQDEDDSSVTWILLWQYVDSATIKFTKTLNGHGRTNI